MLEFFFLLLFLSKLFFLAFWVVLFLAYFTYCAFYCNPYKFFTSSWLETIASLYLYISPIKHIYQRLKYGCSWEDAWNFDQYLLTQVLPTGLNHLRESNLVNLAEKEYNDMLGGIEAYYHMYECPYEYSSLEDCPYSHKKIEEDFEKAMSLITKHFKGLWI